MSAVVLDPFVLFLYQWIFPLIFIVVGEGYYATLFRSKWLAEDMIQEIFYRYIFGLALLFLLHLLISSFLPIFSLLTVTYFLLGGILALLHIFKRFRNDELNLDMIRNRIRSVSSESEIVGFSIVLILLTILVSSSLSGYVASTNNDAATHTFYVRVLLEQQKIPLSVHPFHGYVISYPLGVHSLLASLVALGIPIHSVVLLSTSLLPVASALAAYTSFSTIFKVRTIGLLSGIIAGFSSRVIIAPLGWGGVPSGIANVFFLALLGFSYRIFIHRNVSRSSLISSAVITGLLPWLHPATAILAVIWCIACLACGLIDLLYDRRRSALFQSMKGILWQWVIFIAIAGLVLMPYLLNVSQLLSYPNQGYPPDVPRISSSGVDVAASSLLSILDFDFLLDFPSLVSFGAIFGLVSSIFPFSLIAFFIEWLRRKHENSRTISIPSSGRRLHPFPVIVFYLVLIIYLMFIRNIVPNLPVGSVITAAIQGVFVRMFYNSNLLIIPLSSFVIYSVYKYAGEAYSHVNMISKQRRSERTSILTGGVVLLISLGFLIGMLSYVVTDSNLFYSRVKSSQAIYNSVTPDDIGLMLWMNDHLQNTDVVLVGYNDAGQYVSAVTGLRTIYEYAERIRTSLNYNELLRIISQNPLNSSALPLLEYYEITYIFVGAKTLEFSNVETSYSLNASDLIRAPWIYQVVNFGNATLLRFSD